MSPVECGYQGPGECPSCRVIHPASPPATGKCETCGGTGDIASFPCPDCEAPASPRTSGTPKPMNVVLGVLREMANESPAPAAPAQLTNPSTLTGNVNNPAAPGVDWDASRAATLAWMEANPAVSPSQGRLDAILAVHREAVDAQVRELLERQRREILEKLCSKCYLAVSSVIAGDS